MKFATSLIIDPLKAHNAVVKNVLFVFIVIKFKYWAKHIGTAVWSSILINLKIKVRAWKERQINKTKTIIMSIWAEQ